MLSIETAMQVLYSTLSHKKKKERFETILEPLQAILQIGFLSFSPIGTKLTIQNNILYLQQPSYSQPITRWYNNDTQEDLFYLFNIFYRFKKFYGFMNEKNKNNINSNLYSTLIEFAIGGIVNLIRTYSQTEKIHILHTLQMYKSILEDTSDTIHKRFDSFELEQKNEVQYNNNLRNVNSPIVSPLIGPNQNSTMLSIPPNLILNDNKKNKTKHKHSVIPDDSYSESQISNEENSNQQIMKNEQIMKNDLIQQSNNGNMNTKIDDVFIRITEVYSQELYNIIYNTLIILKNSELNHQHYIDGLNKILEPTNIIIKKWIDENIVF